MSKRKELKDKITQTEFDITQLQAQVIELHKELYLLCDEERWFTESEETEGRGKKKRTRLIGKINWKEDFIDEDTGDVVTVQRYRIVRIDGEWLDF